MRVFHCQQTGLLLIEGWRCGIVSIIKVSLMFVIVAVAFLSCSASARGACDVVAAHIVFLLGNEFVLFLLGLRLTGIWLSV